jgi:hypothetical protein
MNKLIELMRRGVQFNFSVVRGNFNFTALVGNQKIMCVHPNW